MLSFFRYTMNPIVRPRATLRAMLEDPRRLALGFGGLLALTAVYVITLSVAIAKDLAPHEMLILRIPAEQYYFYERLFLLPVAIDGTILAAGATRLTAKLCNGPGEVRGSLHPANSGHLHGLA